MNENAFWAILATLVFATICFFKFTDKQESIEMAKQGYEQVVSDGEKVWQKRKESK